MRKVLFLFILSVLLLSSCTVTQSFTITEPKNLTGHSNIDIETDYFFNMVMEDLSSWSDEQENITDSAIKSFADSLSSIDTAGFVNFAKTGDSSWTGSFYFLSFEDLVKSLSQIENQDIITVTRENESTRLVLKINMDNYETLTETVPFLSDSNFEVYGPKYNNYMDKQDYLEMISFILGEDGPESIENSKISITITTPDPVKDTNAKKVNSNTVEFTFPLIDFLLLKEEISFYCLF